MLLQQLQHITAIKTYRRPISWEKRRFYKKLLNFSRHHSFKKWGLWPIRWLFVKLSNLKQNTHCRNCLPVIGCASLPHKMAFNKKCCCNIYVARISTSDNKYFSLEKSFSLISTIYMYVPCNNKVINSASQFCCPNFKLSMFWFSDFISTVLTQPENFENFTA